MQNFLPLPDGRALLAGPIARKFRKPDASVQRDIHELSRAVPATC
jgi:hypothetical protein